MVGISCSQATVTDEVVWLKEQAPRNVKSFALEGANVVQWDYLSNNLYGIAIERYEEGNTEPSKLITCTSKATYYIDTVSDTNPLKNDVVYKYRVYSLGGAQKARAVTVANSVDTTLSSDYVETSVKATIPARGAQIAKLADTDVSAYFDDGVIYVTVPENYVYTTKISFEPTGTEGIISFSTINPSDYTYAGSNNYKSYTFPYTDSKIDVKVTRTFGSYYKESEVAKVTVEGSKKVLPGAVTLTAASKSDRIVLSWPADTTAATYTLYKAEKDNGSISGGYSALSTAQKVTTFNETYYPDGIYYVEDTDVVYGKTYSYYLVKKLGDAYKTSTKEASVSAVTLGAVTLNLTVADKTVRLNFAGIKYAEKYELYRYERDDDGNPVESTKVTIAVPDPVYKNGSTDYEFGYYETTDETVEVGKTYCYVLIATAKDGSVSQSTKSTGTIALSTASITSVNVGYNADDKLYIDWNCAAPTCKVYYYTTDNNGDLSASTYVTTGITTEKINKWRCVTSYKNPNTEKTVVDYKKITYVVESYDENGGLIDTYVAYTLDIDYNFTKYVSFNITSTDTSTAGKVVFSGTGVNLPSTLKGYYKKSAGDSDWKGADITVVKGTAVTGSDNVYNFTIEVSLPAGDYTLELLAKEDIEMFTGTVKAGNLIKSASVTIN